jgi:hypothetical protein
MRTPVIASGFRRIGKETDRRWEQGEDLSIIETDVTEYSPGETDVLVTDLELISASRDISIRPWAKRAGLARTQSRP